MLDMKEFAQRLIEADLALPPLIRGCSEEEIADLESQAGRRLPAVYRSFLQVMGRDAGNLFRGTDMFYNRLPQLPSYVEEFMARRSLKGILPDDAFVFSMHQGYEIMFFRTSEGDDPPVYQFATGMAAPTRPWDSFSAFLEDALYQHEHAYDEVFE